MIVNVKYDTVAKTLMFDKDGVETPVDYVSFYKSYDGEGFSMESVSEVHDKDNKVVNSHRCSASLHDFISKL